MECGAEIIKVILFDVDQTVTSIEGLDELAKMKNDASISHSIEQLTKAAMNGKLDFVKALQERLSIIQPTKQDMQRLSLMYLDEKLLAKDATSVVRNFKQQGWKTGLVTGGLKQAIEPLAQYLDVDYFDAVDYGNGNLKEYLGKCKFIENLRNTLEYKNSCNTIIVMVGDGATDLATKPYVDLMIGYAEFCETMRVDKLIQEADIVVKSFAELSDILLKY